MSARDKEVRVCIHDNYFFARYLELLQQHKPKMKWDDHCSEHYFTYK